MPVKSVQTTTDKTKGPGKSLSSKGPPKEKSLLGKYVEREIEQKHAQRDAQVKELGGRSGFENMIRAQQARIQGLSHNFV